LNSRNKFITPAPFGGQALLAVIALMLAIMAMPASASADQPDIINAAVMNLPPTGDAGSIRCQLQITNPNPAPVMVEIPAVRSPLGYVVNATPSRVSLNPRQEALVELLIGLAADGKYQVFIPLVVQDARGQTKREASVDLYFEVLQRRYTQSSFRALFANPIAIERDEKGRLVQMYPAGPLPAGLEEDPESKTPHADVEELERMQRSTVFETDWGQSPTLRTPAPKRTSESRDGSTEGTATEFLFKQNDIPAALSGVTATAIGTLKFTSLKGSILPCYGWRVVAYEQIGGTKIGIRTGNVKSNGDWKLEFVPHGFPIKIEYQPENAFFSLADPADNTYYSFSSGVVYNPSAGDTINEGTLAPYMANGSLAGLGDIYRDGMLLWDALKTKGGGISPLRDQSIVVYYPNMTYTCGMDKPWSCANPGGFVWLIPKHAKNRNTMIHELSHQINFEYWNNNNPSPGGPHYLYGCQDVSLAMVEGFADFMPRWVRFTQTGSEPDLGGVESPPLNTCPLQNSNELWVAATFWDLYDIMTDGDDDFAFSNQGATVGIYLKYGPRTHMGLFRSVYKSSAPIGDQAKVVAIFAQNFQ